MKIDCLILGAYQTNCYILREGNSSEDCLIIDTGLDADNLVKFLQTEKLNPLAVILTHGHPDHTAGVAALRKNFQNIKVYIHKTDAKMLTSRTCFLLAGKPFHTTDPADFLIEEPMVIELAGIKLHILNTPGHTPGGICLYAKEENIIFVGDTLFADSVGRTDLGGNMNQLITSIKQKLLTLPGETIVFPGHGPQTTIEQEKKYNPYLQ
jgi:glyoxylase-like metal-dependent hydrolase (beta-lactamase superfamily II)